MKSISALAAALALTMGLSAVAQAQPHREGRRADRHGPPPHMQPQGHPPHYDRRGDHRDEHRHDRRGDRRDERRDWERDRHGAGPDHRWVKGYRLPPEYRGQHYVVHDWRGHRLSAPPRGYQWVQYGGDYMLVAIASGVIAQLILGSVR